MSSNRFEFLEFGEDGTPLVPQQPLEKDLPTGEEPRGLRAPDGTPLAQVRVTDSRGYEAVLGELRREEGAQSRQDGLRLAEVIGQRGDGVGQFNFPTGIAVDQNGVLFVADSYNHRVQRVTPDGGVSVLGARGGGRGQFLSPQGVATDLHSAFYIVEQGNCRVQKYSEYGLLLLVFGRAGRGEGEMRGPTDIAIAPGTGDIYVADTGNSRVQRFDREGNFLSTIGKRGGLHTPLVSPQSVTVDTRDNLYIADTFAHRVVKYDPLGRLVGDFRPSGLHEPRALARDAGDLLFLADTAPSATPGMGSLGRLQVLEARSGKSRLTVGSPHGTGALMRPGGLAVASPTDQSAGGVYLADTMNHRILRYVWS